jgi:hypothetical protein
MPVELHQRQQRLRERRHRQGLQAIQHALARKVDGKALVQPERHVPALQRLVQGHVRELVVEHLGEIVHGVRVQGLDGEQHQCEARIGHTFGIFRERALGRRERRHLTGSARDTHDDVLQHRVTKQVAQTLAKGVGVTQQGLHAVPHRRRKLDLQPAPVMAAETLGRRRQLHVRAQLERVLRLPQRAVRVPARALGLRHTGSRGGRRRRSLTSSRCRRAGFLRYRLRQRRPEQRSDEEQRSEEQPAQPLGAEAAQPGRDGCRST